MSSETLRPQRVLRPYALLYFYRRRLRVHAVQELLAGVGVAVAVALVFASLVAAGSVAGSASEVVRAVTGPAQLQLHARSPQGLSQALLARVERLPGVAQAAPLLEQTATVSGPGGRSVTVDLAGADTSLVVLDGLAHTLPRATLQAGGIGLSRATAQRIGLRAGAAGAVVPTSASERGPVAAPGTVTLRLGGRALHLPVSAVLGPEAFGALSQALVAVMPLEELQRLSGLWGGSCPSGCVSRILVATKPGQTARVRRELQTLAGGSIDVAPANQDVALLRQALRPADQASAFFATVSGLLGVLFALTALLLTIPERRRAIADLRLIGVRGGAIAQMLVFQALALGVLASLAGLAGGWLLALHILHQRTGYLAEAFTLGTKTVIGAQPLVLALAGGIAAACLASAVPLLDLRRGRALDAVYHEQAAPGSGLSRAAQRALGGATLALLLAATLLFALDPSPALLACALLALAAVLAVPLALGAVLTIAHAFAERFQRLTVLPVALSALRATAPRSLALAATGAVALFGAVALGGARGDLSRGIERFARAYSADAQVWVGTPDDNQAAVPFQAGNLPERIAKVPGVAGVREFGGDFVQIAGRRVWLLARPPGGARHVLAGELQRGSLRATLARLEGGGWVALSAQLASALHTRVGDTVTLPTPSGPAALRVAATTTNLAWSPGAVLVGLADYRRLWKTRAPTALAVQLAPGSPRRGGQASADAVHARIQALLPHAGTPSGAQAGGLGSGLVATTAAERERRIDSLTGEGLGQLGEIATLLLVAAVLAMAAALTSAIWQRRPSLAALRLSGVRPRRLRAILAVESALMLGAGCLTGLVAGVYGQLVIDGYLRHTTGFPVTSLGATLRPLELLALLAAAVLAIVLAPTWAASRVPPTLVFDE